MSLFSSSPVRDRKTRIYNITTTIPLASSLCSPPTLINNTKYNNVTFDDISILITIYLETWKHFTNNTSYLHFNKLTIGASYSYYSIPQYIKLDYISIDIPTTSTSHKHSSNESIQKNQDFNDIIHFTTAFLSQSTKS